MPGSIAIESEREFGLSVLENDSTTSVLKRTRRHVPQARCAGPARLSRQAQARSDINAANAADRRRVPGVVRRRRPDIAQDAALLLDRLVRQGRAFGIHVLLGSQTLGRRLFAAAEPRSGQMAVRIALQCSESDAHLILSEDNTAARLLGASRRGDLQRRQRAATKATIRFRSSGCRAMRSARTIWSGFAPSGRGRRSVQRHRRPIVFEGSAAADPSAQCAR